MWEGKIVHALTDSHYELSCYRKSTCSSDVLFWNSICKVKRARPKSTCSSDNRTVHSVSLSSRVEACTFRCLPGTSSTGGPLNAAFH